MRTFAVAVLLLPLAGCGGDEVVGVWGLPQNMGTIEFKSDGTFVVNASGGGMNMNFNGTWDRVDATHVHTHATIEFGGQTQEQDQTMEVTVSGDTMTVKEPDGTTNTYTRQ